MTSLAPKAYVFGLTAAEIEQRLNSLDNFIQKDVMRQSLSSPSADTIPSTQAVVDALDPIQNQLQSLGSLAGNDSVSLDSEETTGVLPVTKGGTGGNTVELARQNLGILTQDEIQTLIDDSVSELGSVDLSSSQVTNVLPMVKGGTGADTPSQARANLGVWSSAQSEVVKTNTREALRRSYAEAGYNLVDGSFEAGGTLVNANDVLLQERTGNGYSWGGVLPKNVPAGSTPESTGGISADAWSPVALPSTLFAPATTASTMALPERTVLLNARQLSGSSLVGQGANSKLKAAAGAASVLRLGDTGAADGWYARWLSRLSIDGNSKLSNGVEYSNGGTNDHFAGRWDISNVMISNCNIGIHKPKGNIGNHYQYLRIKNNNIGYKAIGQVSPIMHAGCDVFEGGQFGSNALAAVLVDSPIVGTGQTVFRDTIFEANPGFGIFVKNWSYGMTPFVIDNCWFEFNATAAQVTIDGVNYTPKDIRLDNTAYGVIQKSRIGKTEINNSAVLLDGVMMDDTTSLVYDGLSAVTARNVYINGGFHSVVVNSLAGSPRILGNRASVFRAPARIKQSSNALLGVVNVGQSYHGAATYTFYGSTTATGKKYPDGRVFDTCCEVPINASQTHTGTQFTCTAGKYYVMTLDVKHMAGDINGLTIKYADGGVLCSNFSSLLKTGEWVTIACVGKADTTFTARLNMAASAAGGQTLRLSAEQVVEFDNYDDAIQFYNNREYAGAASLPRVSYGSAIPTIGVWKVGDQIINSAPSAGGIYGWVCTTAGDAATTAVFKPISTIGA